jgi:energy-coupling factor transporter ATP-binding protein EcfA2
MKIISLQAENFKKLHAIEITPDGNFVQITGKNGQGKSSTLDAIWVALAGIGVAPKEPIRKGAQSAKIRLDLGEIVVTRHFKRADAGEFTTQLTVESADGARFPSPQRMLDGLLGALSFDPLAFSRMDGKQQFDALRKFVPGVDFDAIDRAQAGDYQRRTDINRRMKDAKAAADNIRVADKPPVEQTDESALVAKLKEAGDHNADVTMRRANREKMAEQIEAEQGKLANLVETIRVMQLQADQLGKSIEERTIKLGTAPELPALIDTAAVAEELNVARTNNRLYATWTAHTKNRVDLLALAKKLEQESADLTAAMAQRLKDKQAAIAAASLPIQGISFGEGTVLLNDVPFDQASDAEKLRASVEMAMAANPKLRVIRIRDGSLLDEEGLKLVAEMADKRNCQVWLERVDGSGKVGIVLENGAIKVPVLEDAQ